MPKVCKKVVFVGDQRFEGEIYLLPDSGEFIFIFPNDLMLLEKNLTEFGLEVRFRPKRGNWNNCAVAAASTKKDLENKIYEILEAYKEIGAEESLVIFYKFGFQHRRDKENISDKILDLDDFKTGYSEHETGMNLYWRIIREFKYSSENILYKFEKYDNEYSPSKNEIKVTHTVKLQEFFESFDSAI